MSKETALAITGELVNISELEKIEGSKKIIDSFSPKAGELNALYPEYDEIVKGYVGAIGIEVTGEAGITESILSTAPEDKQAQAATAWASKAKTLRAKVVKVRTSTGKVHKTVKDEYLPVTKAIDAMNRIIRDKSQNAEGILAFIADTEKRLEALRLERLESSRTAELQQYADGNPLPSGLSAMDDATWDAVLSGWKAKHEAKLKADAEEAARQEKEKLGTDRKLKVAPYADYIPGFVAMDFSTVTEKEFAGILEAGKTAKEEKDREIQELREKAAAVETPAISDAEGIKPTVSEDIYHQKQKRQVSTSTLSPFIQEIKDYLFRKMMDAPTPADADRVRRAMESLG